MSAAIALVRAAEAAGVRLEARLWCDAPDRLAPELRARLAGERPAVLRLLLDEAMGGGEAAPTRTAGKNGVPAPILPLPASDGDAHHQATLDGWRRAALRRPPSWTPASALPSPGAFCTCCAGQRWWCERERPSGWCCATCYAPVHLDLNAIREIAT